MRLPITKIKAALREGGYSFSHVEVSFWHSKLDPKGSTANMLNMESGSDVVDIGTLAKNDVHEVEDDGMGFIKLDLRLSDSNFWNTDYVEAWVIQGEVHLKLPKGLDTELGRAVYLANKKGAACTTESC